MRISYWSSAMCSSDLRAKVSSTASAPHQPASASHPTTVRHTPLTEMYAPKVTSSRTVLAPMRSREPSRETRWPSSSMMPVNTSGPPGVEIYEEVVAQLGDGCEATAREDRKSGGWGKRV